MPTPPRPGRTGIDAQDRSFRTNVDLRRPGGPGEAARPDPIPNSAVKRFSAHGTVPQGPGESVAARPAKIDAKHLTPHQHTRRPRAAPRRSPTKAKPSDAGWSSPVARQAHNLKAAGSNPAPATTTAKPPTQKRRGLFAVRNQPTESAPASLSEAIRRKPRRGNGSEIQVVAPAPGLDFGQQGVGGAGSTKRERGPGRRRFRQDTLPCRTCPPAPDLPARFAVLVITFAPLFVQRSWLPPRCCWSPPSWLRSGARWRACCGSPAAHATGTPPTSIAF